jgi:hypothetical protein
MLSWTTGRSVFFSVSFSFIMVSPQVDIKAIVHDAGIPEGIGAMSVGPLTHQADLYTAHAQVLNHYYGRDDILLGAYKGSFGRWVARPAGCP